MNLLKFFMQESATPWTRVLVTAAVSGVASSALMVIIISAAQNAAKEGNGVSLRSFFLFGIAFVIAYIARKYATSNTTIRIESAINKARSRIINQIRHTELTPFESLDKSYLYSRVTQDTNFISQIGLTIITACQSATVIVCCLFYVAWLSMLACIILVAAISAVTFIYFLKNKKEEDKLLEIATEKDTELFECLSHILDGFKEIRLNKQKNDDLFTHYQGIADSSEEVKVKIGLGFLNTVLLAQIFFYSLIAVILFLLPTLISAYSGVILKTVMAILFLVGPLEFVVSSISIITRANKAIGNLYHLEDLLDKANDHETSGKSEDQLGFSREINLEKITFSYTDTKGNALFTLGPMNLSIKQGEVLFVVGGNGSGKSTLLKLITGLYYPMHGSILLDDKKISNQNFPAYREFFSAVFADFHLFDRFYGLGEVKAEKVNNLIKTMNLDTKTQYIDGKFSDINLSTGQRKRLALIVAFLDDKPVYILDEVTADQDPKFRKYFYEELLLDLKKRGKTVIIATHDDRYFHVADRVLKLDYGQLNDS